MQLAAGAGLRSLVAKCQREAQRRGQAPSTAHLLVVMLRSDDEAGALLREHGLREHELLGALRMVDPEGSGALDRALESSQRIAAELGERAPRSLHLLMAITRDVRSGAHKGLAAVGATPQAVYRSARAWLGLDVAEASAEPPRAAAPKRENRPPILGRPPRTRRPVDPRPRARHQEARAGATPTDGAEARASATPSAGTEAHAGTAPAGTQERPPAARRDKAQRGATRELGPFDLDPERYPMLTALGRNLTADAAEGRVDPVIGRDVEIGRLLDILARRRSNNPILVGPPGVGKTAVAEGLALALVGGGPEVRGLEDRLLIEVSAGALVSGTAVRGPLSERIRKLREEVARSEGRVVLFIDEIHAVVGGGEGPDDLAHELKSALSRGELACVGATTEAEYRKHFERDPALCRRFSPVYVDEPSAEDALSILEGIAPRYEAHHRVRYDEDALRSAVELSARYMPDRMLPDKAIGIVDLAAARVRRRGGSSVDLRAVAEVIADQARVPVDRLLSRDADRLLRLEALLAERVVGHTDVMTRVADSLRKGAAGFRGRRPLATFLLLGPTGVGKTETAKAVSELFFPGSPMTRIDMSELGEAHTVARLLGAPPGYVGHEDGGQLTEPVRRRPYQLVLLDEIEKAHMDVLLALLPLLDEGRLTDGRGRTVDFTNTIVMMTSNLGADAGASAKSGIGFGRAATPSTSAGRGRDAALGAARGALPPELWNRIDEPLYFGRLTPEDVAEIARRMLGAMSHTLAAKHGLELEVEASAIEALVLAGGYDAALGARPMRRVIGRLVEAKLASAILEGKVPPRARVRLFGEGADVGFSVEALAPSDATASSAAG